MTVGENIRKFRKEKGLTQKRLGEQSNINEVQIRQYELGKAKPKLETIMKIADALDISVTQLLNPDILNLTDSIVNIFYDSDIKSESLDINEPMERCLIINFRELNETGRKKAIECVEDLTKITDYTRKNNLNAAHAIPGSNEEDIQHDEDTMNDVIDEELPFT